MVAGMQVVWLAACVAGVSLWVDSALRLSRDGLALIDQQTRSPIAVSMPMVVKDNSEWISSDLNFTDYHLRQRLGPFRGRCVTAKHLRFCLHTTHVYYLWDDNYDLPEVAPGQFRHAQELCREATPFFGFNWFRLLPETSLFLTPNRCLASDFNVTFANATPRFKPLWVIFRARANVTGGPRDGPYHKDLVFSLPAMSPYETLDGLYTRLR